MKNLLIDEIYDDLAEGKIDKRDFLFLEAHDKLPRQWSINSFDAAWMARMDGSFSRFGAVSVWGFEKFEQAAAEQGYQVCFLDDPKPVFDWFQSLNAEPDIELDLPELPNAPKTIKGMLPFQVQGFNFMKSTERMVYFNWSTGTGKTVAAEATIMEKQKPGSFKDGKGFDICLYCVRPNNTKGSLRKLRKHTGRDAIILKGTPKKREKLYAEIAAKMQRGQQPIVILNPEKYREDTEFMKLLVEDHNVLFIFDEMAKKYSNRSKNQLYKATCEVLYTSVTNKGVPFPKIGSERALQMYSVALSATPIRNCPEDIFNQVRLLDPSVLGTVNDFNNSHVAGRDRWFNVTAWKNLDYLSAKLAHVIHQADKENDPDIKSQFPEVLPPETILVDLDPKAEKLYARLEEALDIEAIKRGESMLDFDDLLASIGAMQMICSNPKVLLDSAKLRDEFDIKLDAYIESLDPNLSRMERDKLIKTYTKKYAKGSTVAQRLRAEVGNDALFADRDNHGTCTVTKLLELRDRIENFDGKLNVFVKEVETGKSMSEWFDAWGITHVFYHGSLTDAVKDDVYDRFRENPDIKVFLSSDAGSDSIDLPESTKTIHYELPFTWDIKKQRENRMHRIDSHAKEVQVEILLVPDTVEDRFVEIIETKWGYHDKVLGGEIADQADAMISQRDWLYVLTGERV